MRFCASLRFAACLASLTAAVLAADGNTATERIQAHTTFLADDLLEGRGTGTRGYDLAARYVASQFARIGLEPGADGGSYLQPMKLIEATNKLEAGRLVISHGGKEDALAPVSDMFTAVNSNQDADSVTAPAVFVGYGVQAPELDHDDYAGVDLRGRIAIVLLGAPKQFPTTQRAHHANGDNKRRLLAKLGAVGVITIIPPWDEARYPWAFFAGQARFPTMRLLDGSGQMVNVSPQLKVLGTATSAVANRLFAPAGRTAEEVFAKAERGEPQSFALNAEITLAADSTRRPVESANVLGWLPGADPALADQPIVVTGHLDHLGIGAPVNGDSIYNGAMDNAVGIAMILAAAEELAAGPRPARPVLFAALTAEEKGLLGAYHLTRNPPARVRHFAANVNVDMPLFPVAVRSLIAWGEDHTTLGPLTHAAAARTGFTVTPDPMPEETIFVRSDQYAFVQTGVPAIYLSSGMKPVDSAVDLPGMWGSHLKERYHKPSDDLDQPIDWPSTGAFTGLMVEVIRDAANARPAPAWLPGDFFGELFGRR